MPFGAMEDATKSYEPVIYKVMSMEVGPNDELIKKTGIDNREFELAIQSGNLHRLSEAEAKALLQEIQNAMPETETAEGQ